MDFDNADELSLRFIDEEAASLLPRPSINSYSRVPKS
jgi:hypothetical protein